MAGRSAGETSRQRQDLQAELAAICLAYFPRWRQAKAWTLREGPRGQWLDEAGTVRTTSEYGYCDPATRTLWVQSGAAQRLVTIIHECCHAVTTGRHGPRFRARLCRAAL
jgi:predicted metal-dependent hydrolase